MFNQNAFQALFEFFLDTSKVKRIKSLSWEHSYFVKSYNGKLLKYSILLSVLPRDWLDLVELCFKIPSSLNYQWICRSQFWNFLNFSWIYVRWNFILKFWCCLNKYSFFYQILIKHLFHKRTIFHWIVFHFISHNVKQLWV